MAGNSSEIYICTVCHFIGKPKVKGSGGIEFVLWICYLIPGLIYHLWRHSGKGNKCSECGSAAMIPVTTPKAQEIIGTSEKQTAVLQEKSSELEGEIGVQRKKDNYFRWFIFLSIAALIIGCFILQIIAGQ